MNIDNLSPPCTHTFSKLTFVSTLTMNSASHPAGYAMPGPTVHPIPNAIPASNHSDHTRAASISILTGIMNDKTQEINRLRTENATLQADKSRLQHKVKELEERCTIWQSENLQLWDDNTRLNQYLTSTGKAGQHVPVHYANRIKVLENKLMAVTQEGKNLLQKHKETVAWLSLPSEDRVKKLWDDYQLLRHEYNVVHQKMMSYKDLLDDGVRRGIYRYLPDQNQVKTHLIFATGVSESFVCLQQSQSNHTISPTQLHPVHVHPRPHSQFNSPREGHAHTAPPNPHLPHVLPELAANAASNQYPYINSTSQTPGTPIADARTDIRPPNNTYKPSTFHSQPPSPRTDIHPPNTYKPSTFHSQPPSPQHSNQSFEQYPVLPTQNINSSGHVYSPIQSSPTHTTHVFALPTPHPPAYVPQFARPSPQQKDHPNVPVRSPERRNYTIPPTPPQSHKSMTPEESCPAVVKRNDSPVPLGDPTPPQQYENRMYTFPMVPINVSETAPRLKRPSLSMEPHEPESPKRARLDSGNHTILPNEKASPDKIVDIDHETTFPNPKENTSEESQILVAEPIRHQEVVTTEEPQLTVSEKMDEGQGKRAGLEMQSEEDIESDEEPLRGPDGLFEEMDVVDWLLVGTAEDEDYGEDGVKICVLCRERVKSKQTVPQYQFVHPTDDELLSHFRTHHNTAFSSARKEGPTYVS
ncbi:hypothetical protein K435DRAFT_6369 [Dendrothele bispora CBS 962.96]|uniref:Uncharacterized protein n=1 Tax=Dendrothele bispora (strain CBS 962.96) TaxID=1314807 RepID=A0A4S8N0B4_DENBC|nr:hypothetical protein K435DRAFT_6369 [Dendrothele bispora CBS 962.96]